jgi:hypothetical protein
VPVPLPDVQLAITPPGGSTAYYTDYLAYDGPNQQISITQNFGRQGDTALLVLAEEHSGTPGIVIPPMSQVKFHDTTAGQTLFAGVVTAPSLCPAGPNLAEWDLACTDYTIYADNAIVRWPPSGIQASDQIVIALTNGAGCGINAVAYADGGYVAPGPALPEWTLGWTTLSSAWRTLASTMGQVVPYGWYVDETRALHFFDATTAQDSGVTFTTTPTAAGSLYEGHILLDSTFSYAWDGTSIRNRVMVQGATQTFPYSLSAPPTDTFLANGADTSWPLRFTVADSPAPVLYVGGAATAVTVESSGSAPSGPWSVVQNASGGYFLIAAAAPAAGTPVQVWYSYQAPVLAQANDTQSQALYSGPNGGVYAEFISDSTLTSMPMALARAQQDRTEYAFAAERVTFNTSPDWVGWVRAGQTFTLDCALVWDTQSDSWGVNDTFIAIANQVTFGEGGYRTCQLTGVRL